MNYDDDESFFNSSTNLMIEPVMPEFCADENTREIKHYLTCLKRLSKSQLNSINTPSILTHFIKRILYSAANSQNQSYLSDVCSTATDIFVDLRVVLGYLASGKTEKSKSLIVLLEDIILETETLLDIYISYSTIFNH